MLQLEAGYMGAVQHLTARKYQLANTGGSIYGVSVFYAPQHINSWPVKSITPMLGCTQEHKHCVLVPQRIYPMLPLSVLNVVRP